jgi:hypothetical protein
MKLRFILISIGIFIILIIVIPIGLSFKHMSGLLEFANPSQNIIHSIKKNVFIDSLMILNSETISLNKFEQRIDIVPTSAWVEKRALWKSKTIDFDSLYFQTDTLELLVNFKNYVNGLPWNPKNYGSSFGEFQNINGVKESVYIVDNITQLNFKINSTELNDTIRLTTADAQQIILIRGN